MDKLLPRDNSWTVFFRSPDYETRVVWGQEQPKIALRDITISNGLRETIGRKTFSGRTQAYSNGGLQRIVTVPLSELDSVEEKYGVSSNYMDWIRQSIEQYGNGIGRSIKNVNQVDSEWGSFHVINYNNQPWLSFHDLCVKNGYAQQGRTLMQKVDRNDILTVNQLVRLGECAGAMITPEAAERFVLQRNDAYRNSYNEKRRMFILTQVIPRVKEIAGLIPESEKPLVPCSTYEVGQFTFRTNEESIPMISSRVIAKEFGKQNQVVNRSIRTVQNCTVLLPEDIIETTYINEQNKQQVEYLLSQKAFFAVAGGFTGEKALRLRVHIYEAFEALLHRVRNLETIVARQLAQPPAVPALPETVFSTETESVRERANRVIRNKSEDTGNYAREWSKLFKKLKDEYGLDLPKLQKAMGLQSAIEVVDWVPRAAEIVSEVLNSMEE